jgi:hypothetical protein
MSRADGTIKRGRGGRGGRGGGRARATQGHVPIASNVPISAETGLPLRGPGSRGGSLARKPRSSKAKQQQGEDKSELRVVNSTQKSSGNASQAANRKAPSSMAGMVGLAPATPIPIPAPASGPQLAPAPPAPQANQTQSVFMR